MYLKSLHRKVRLPLKERVTKLSNKNLINAVLKQITNFGYNIKDIAFSDTYFVMEADKDSICQFRIKEIPRFFICTMDG